MSARIWGVLSLYPLGGLDGMRGFVAHGVLCSGQWSTTNQCLEELIDFCTQASMLRLLQGEILG